jgi:hypothetical protein
MKIIVFEVEDWEREAVERILSTTVGNIVFFTRGEPENVISRKQT